MPYSSVDNCGARQFELLVLLSISLLLMGIFGYVLFGGGPAAELNYFRLALTASALVSVVSAFMLLMNWHRTRLSQANLRPEEPEGLEWISCSFRPDGAITRTGRSFDSFFSTGPASFVGGNFFDLIHPADVEGAREMLGALSASAPAISLDLRHRSALTGQPITHRWTFKAVFSPEGRITECHGAGQDISFLKYLALKASEAEDALEKEKRLSESIFTATGMAVSLQTPDYRIIHQNNIHSMLVGDITGRHCYEALEGRDKVCERCPLEASFRLGTPQSVLWKQNEHRGGHYMEITTLPVHDSDGKLLYGIEVARRVTDQKRAEHETAAKLQMLAETLDAHTDILCRLKIDGSVLFANRAFLRFFDIFGSDIHLLNVFTSAAFESAGSLRGSLGMLSEESPSLVFEEQLFSRGMGQYRHMRFDIQMLRDADDMPCGYFVAASDNTSANKLHEMLMQSERLLADAHRMARLGSWRWDIPANKIHLSVEARRLLGVDASKTFMTYEEYLNFLHPDERKSIDRFIQETIVQGETISFDFRVVKHSGEEAIFNFIGEIEHNLAGEPVMVSGTAQDITQRKRNELRLIESKERLNSIVTALGEGVIDLSPHMAITDASMRAAQILGYDRSAMIGRTIYYFMPPEEAKAKADSTAIFIQSGAPFAYDTVFKDGAGNDINIELNFVSCYANNSYICVIKDMSERINAEKALCRSASVMEQTFMHSSVPMAVLDEGLLCFKCNNAMTEIFASTRSALIGKGLAHFVGAREAKKASKALESGTTFHSAGHEIKNSPVEGRFCDFSITRLKGHNKLLYLLSLYNVTDHVNYQMMQENMIGRLNEQIEKSKMIEGPLSVCPSCKALRNGGDWVTLEQFMHAHSSVEINSRLCHTCSESLYPHGPSEGKDVQALSAREKEVLGWIKHGKSTWDISQILGISGNTVKFHVASILKKLDVSSRAQAVAVAIKLGQLEEDLGITTGGSQPPLI